MTKKGILRAAEGALPSLQNLLPALFISIRRTETTRDACSPCAHKFHLNSNLWSEKAEREQTVFFHPKIKNSAGLIKAKGPCSKNRAECTRLDLVCLLALQHKGMGKTHQGSGHFRIPLNQAKWEQRRRVVPLSPQKIGKDLIWDHSSQPRNSKVK